MIRHLISQSRPHKPKRPPSRTARSFNLQSFPASAGPISRSPTHDSKPPSPPTSHPHPAAAGPGRNEHWRRSPKLLAQQRESSSSPKPTCECRTDPAERATSTPSGGTVTTTPRDSLGYAAFLQNAPVVRHTRGFTPGWYAVPRWGTPNTSPTCERRTGPAEPHPRLKTTISPNITRTPSGSGTGPERALEAITQNPRATARKLILPQAYLRVQDQSRGAPSRH